MDWSDIGSWNELGKLSPEDNYGNNVTGEVILKNTKNCVVHGFDKLIATIGLEDLVIVDTSDALLIVNKDSTQKVKEIVTELKTLKSPLYKIFQTVHRPWGTYTVLQEYDSFKIKRIEVKPNSKLSLQSHKFRSEHWIVVSGVAHITLGENVSRLETNQSIYIPVEEKHCIENKGDEILIIVEVQCGKYLGRGRHN